MTKSTTDKRAAATRTTLGTFTAKGIDNEMRKCAGACGKRLPVNKFPTTKTPGVRAAECRVCRDKRTKAAGAAK